MSDAGAPPTPEAATGRDTPEFGRGVSYFDAIYGFAATLLVANVDMPGGDAWRSWDALTGTGLGTQLFGFALSFVVIALFWRVSVNQMRGLVGTDGPTTAASLAAAGLVVLIPFTTQGISDPEAVGYALPTAMYALNIALASVAHIAVTVIARARGLESPRTSRRVHLARVADAAVSPVVFAVSIPVALALGPDAAQWTWLSLVVLLPAADRVRARVEAAGPDR